MLHGRHVCTSVGAGAWSGRTGARVSVGCVCTEQPFSEVGYRPLETLSGGQDTESYCYKTKMLFAFFTVFTFVLMAKQVVSETLGSLAQ